MKIVFYGTPDFAVETLKAIYQHGYDIAAVVTSPDKPAGRGQKLRMSAVKKYAIDNDLPVLQPTNLKSDDFHEQLRLISPDLQIIVAFRMLPEKVWNLPPKGTFNIHASLLPQYRGAAPINHAIINGEKETGVTSFFLTHQIDTGSIIAQKKVPIEKFDDAGTLHDKLMKKGAELAIETLEQIKNGTTNPLPQSSLIGKNEALKKAPKIFKNDCQINWEQPLEAIYNFIRGLAPYPGSFTYFTDNQHTEKMVKFYQVEMKYIFHQYETKSIISDGKSYLKVACTDGLLSVKELQQEGKKRMPVEAFLRGLQIDDNWRVK